MWQFLKSAKVRRSKLYFLRDRIGKGTRTYPQVKLVAFFVMQMRDLRVLGSIYTLLPSLCHHFTCKIKKVTQSIWSLLHIAHFFHFLWESDDKVINNVCDVQCISTFACKSDQDPSSLIALLAMRLQREGHLFTFGEGLR